MIGVVLWSWLGETTLPGVAGVSLGVEAGVDAGVGLDIEQEEGRQNVFRLLKSEVSHCVCSKNVFDIDAKKVSSFPERKVL